MSGWHPFGKVRLWDVWLGGSGVVMFVAFVSSHWPDAPPFWPKYSSTDHSFPAGHGNLRWLKKLSGNPSTFYRQVQVFWQGRSCKQVIVLIGGFSLCRSKTVRSDCADCGRGRRHLMYKTQRSADSCKRWSGLYAVPALTSQPEKAFC